jgi:hypothetical protein
VLRSADLTHAGLIVSAGAAAALRFFSDFSFATIRHQAALASLDLEPVSLASFGALLLNSLGYELQRDWFNLSPQAPGEVVALVGVLLATYALLRRALTAAAAAAAVLLSVPVLPVAATAGACVWVLLRPA